MAGTSNFGELLEPGLRTVYGLEYNPNAEMHPKIFRVESTSKQFEESLSLTGFGLAPEKIQGASVSYVDPKQNWVHRLTQVTYGLGYIITREMHDFDQYNKMKAFTRNLARSVTATRETIASNVLNRAFSNSYLGGDGLELCSTAHLLGGGGTYANELSTSADLSESTFEQALIDIGDMVDDAGVLIHAKPKKLVVPNELDFTATKLLNSTLEPETANNAVNPAKGRVPYAVWNYLTDPDAWFILTDIPNGLVVYNSRMPDYTRDHDGDSENAKFKAIFRMVAGWDDPRGIFGSPGG
jgi:hypothetical protein